MKRARQSDQVKAFIKSLERMRRVATRFKSENVHLTDCTTSPEDFMQAKQAICDVLMWAMEELRAAGVISGDQRQADLFGARR